ncbi:hypothetical protein AB0399_08075 [Streptomyces sp. NPDC088194]|uniref:hypothetical protein n=1 Tax=Streptomyces sp. NPDC088194 TaxID=3154931 RepID=UPI00345047FD
MEWATESGDQAMVTWTPFRRSQQATTKRNPGQTISLAQAVQRNQELTELPDAYQRDRGLTQARLAMAYAGIREYDEAAEHAASSLSVARGSGSARTMHETVSAINALGAVHASPAVTELFDAMGEDPELWRGEHS